jgi:outer membrane receptor protein involved in Fe transport
LDNTAIDAYTELDLRFGWVPNRHLEISLIGRNLLDQRHPEFVEFSGNLPGQGLVSTQAERNVTLLLRVLF